MRGWTKDEIRKSKAPLLADRVVAWRRTNCRRVGGWTDLEIHPWTGIRAGVPFKPRPTSTRSIKGYPEFSLVSTFFVRIGRKFFLSNFTLENKKKKNWRNDWSSSMFSKRTLEFILENFVLSVEKLTWLLRTLKKVAELIFSPIY